MPEKPGLPAGGDNLYQPALPGVDLATIEHARSARLQDEIVLLRLVMRQMVAQASAQESSLEVWQGALNALSLAAARLARLLEVERKLAASEDDSLALLALAISEVMEEKGW